MIFQKTKSILYIIIIPILFWYGCKKEESKPVEEPRFFSPSAIKAQVFSDSTIRISWKDNSNVETSFQLQRKVASGTFDIIKETAANDTVFFDSSVIPNTLYSYRVRAINKVAETSFSDEVAIKLDLPTPILAYTFINDSKVNLTWTDNSSLESGFILERSKEGQAFAVLAEPGRNIKAYVDSTIEVNTSYRYRIKAKNKTTVTDYSNLVTAKLNFQSPVLNYTLPGGNVINLSWNDNSQFEKGYTLERSINDGAFAELAKIDSPTLSYKVENLQTANKYAFRVKAYTAKNSSPYSNLKKIYYNTKVYVSTETYNGEAAAEGQVAMSPSTNLIATTSYFSKNVVVANRVSHTTTTIATGHTTKGGYGIKFSADNAYMVITGSNDGNVEVWNTNSLTLNKSVSTGMEAIFSVRLNNSGNLLAVAGTGISKLLVYNFPAMTLKYTLSSDNSIVRDVMFYQNDTKLISAGNDNKIHIWNLGSLQLEKTFTGHTGHIGTIDLNANSSLMVSGSYEDKTLKIWNPTGGLIQTISNSDNISTAFFDSDDNIYFADKGGNFRIINKTGISLFQVTAGNPIHYAHFNENAKLFVTYSANGAIKVFNNTPVWMEY